MALRVIRAMHQQAADGGRKQLPPDSALRVVLLGRECADAPPGSAEACFELVHQVRFGGAGVEFGLQSCELCLVQLIAFRIGEQTVQTARDVPQMIGERREPHRAGVHIVIAECGAPVIHVFLGQLKRVHDLTHNSVEIAMCAAQPGLRLTRRARTCSLFTGSCSLHRHNPFPARNSRTTSVTSRCCLSTASFMACTSSVLTFPARRSMAVWMPGHRRSDSSRTNGTASYGGK